MFDLTNDLSDNIEFKLVKYIQIGLPFVIYKEHYESENPGIQSLYGLMYSEKSIHDYIDKNEKLNNASDILVVKGYVSNRELNTVEYFKSMWKNLSDKSIYDSDMLKDMVDYYYYNQITYVFYVYVIMYCLNVLSIINCIIGYIPLTKNGVEILNVNKLEIQLNANISIFYEFFFIGKLLIDIYYINKYMNYEEGYNYYIFMIKNSLYELIATEKGIDIAKNFLVLSSCISIYDNLENNKEVSEMMMITFSVTVFIVFFNFINFLKYITITQKIIVIFLQMIKDVSSVLFIMMVIVMAMSNAITVIGLFSDTLLDWNAISELDPTIDLYYKGYGYLLLDTISLAMTANSDFLENFKLILKLRSHENLNEYPELKKNLDILSNYESLINILFLIVIYFYIIIMLNFIIAVMSDTYNKVYENSSHMTYNLKARILLEYAWYIEIRAYLSKDSKYILPWKLDLDKDDDRNSYYITKDDNEWLGEISEIKKYTRQALMPVKNHLDDVRHQNGNLKSQIDQVQADNVILKNKVDQLQQSLNNILSKLEISK